jgi:hypothetical protein
MRPMYVLVLEERDSTYPVRYRCGRQQYLADVIMDEQGKELGGDRHETEKAGTKAVGFLAAPQSTIINA